jgi:aspartyl-tRNA(Asn)/glutamyl-tRNA(Gln) amidotransferase subunit B
VNSLRFLRQAIEYEAARQIEIIEDGGTIDQETRLFDSGKGETRSMRSKEEAHDYRYFPDPDLLPLALTPDFVEAQRATLPELPDEKKARFMADYGLSPYDAGVLVAERDTADFFEEVAHGRDAKQAANWVISELFGRLNKAGKGVAASPVSAQSLGGLIDLIADGTISGSIAKTVFDGMFETGKEAAVIVEEQGLKQVTDSGAIEGIIDKVLADNPDKVAEYRGGKDKLFGFFVGQTMRASQGKANPRMVNELLRKKLES